MGYQHVYTIDKMSNDAEGHEHFRVAKHDKKTVQKDIPFNTELQAYEVVRKKSRSITVGRFYGEDEGIGGLFCDCFAGLMGKQCRHIEMVMIAEDTENGLNSGRYYDFDKHRWLDAHVSKPIETIR